MPIKKSEVSAPARTSSGGNKALLFIFFILFLIAAVGFVWISYKHKKAEEQILFLSNPEAREELSKKETEELLANVGKLIILPEGSPVVATIIDVDILKSQQPFYEKAKNNDKLLIYPDKAIIYNPDENIIVNVGPVSIRNTQGEEAPPAEPAVETFSLDIRNGSGATGLANELAEQLNADKRFQVLKVANATNSEYAGFTLVNLTGRDLSALEQALGVSAIEVLPEGEEGSEADAVIILGKKPE